MTPAANTETPRRMLNWEKGARTQRISNVLGPCRSLPAQNLPYARRDIDTYFRLPALCSRDTTCSRQKATSGFGADEPSETPRYRGGWVGGAAPRREAIVMSDVDRWVEVVCLRGLGWDRWGHASHILVTMRRSSRMSASRRISSHLRHPPAPRPLPAVLELFTRRVSP
jgi:hypothetical protein